MQGARLPQRPRSGVPQVLAVLDAAVDSVNSKRFESIKLSLATIGLTVGGLRGALSLWREGRRRDGCGRALAAQPLVAAPPEFLLPSDAAPDTDRPRLAPPQKIVL